MTLRNQLINKRLLDKCWRHIYSSKEKSKRPNSKGPDKVSIQDFKDREDKYLQELYSSLKNGKFAMSKLEGIPVPKQEKGKYRLIAVSNVKDRIVHKAILSLINPLLFDYINTGVSYCGVKKNVWFKKDKDALNTKRAFLKVVEQIEKKRFYVFKSDIKGFYDNVPKRRFLNIFEKLSNEVLHDTSLNPLIKEVIYFKLSNSEGFTGDKVNLLPRKYYGICQGSSLSQFFANLYLADFDNKMRKRYGKRFIRYIDDFIVFFETKEEARAAKIYASRALLKKGLELSPEPHKTKITNVKEDYVTFLGIRIDAKKLSYKRDRIETQKYIKNILDEKNHSLYGRISGNKNKAQSMNNKIKGLGEYLSFYHTEETYDEINKWIQIKKRRKEFESLELLDKGRLKPIIKVTEWNTLFK